MIEGLCGVHFGSEGFGFMLEDRPLQNPPASSVAADFSSLCSGLDDDGPGHARWFPETKGHSDTTVDDIKPALPINKEYTIIPIV